MNTIAKTVAALLKSGHTFVLAAIVSHSGSTPRTSGSRMIVTSDGRGIGTIGGGLLEARAMSRAVELIGQGRSALLPFDLSFETVDTMDMICGGQAEVLLDFIRPTPVNLVVFDKWRNLLEDRCQGWLLTVVAAEGTAVGRIDHCLLTPDGEWVGDCPLSAAERKRVEGAAAETSDMRVLEVDGGFIVVTSAQRVCTAHLLGAGHVALATATIAKLAGFRVAVADDRAEFANRERFCTADEVRVLENFEQPFAGQSIGADDYILILTRGHLHDRTVLSRALRTDAGYIGMIGSRRKRDAVYRALEAEGCSRADFERVHAPIGLSIGAETPEEIAVSIVAEMIRHRASNRRTRVSRPAGRTGH